MKMWKTKTWQLETTGIDGSTMLFGVNIFSYPWTDTEKRIQLPGVPYPVPVYRVIIDGTPHEFAADECSNCVWQFYTCRY